MAEERIVGIDLGTTNSVIAVLCSGEIKVIPNPFGELLTPSVVAFTDNGEWLVGVPAQRQAVTNPGRTIYSIKRFMGRRGYEVTEEEKRVPYKLTGRTDELIRVEIGNRRYLPQELCALILRELKANAEAYLGRGVSKAVITVPAYFNDAQRQATLDAASMAGFDTEWELEDPGTGRKSCQRMRIINEPTAASLAHGLDRKKEEKIAVFHLGGGSLDISILDIDEGICKVLSTNGDTHLGGDDFDQALLDHIADEFNKAHAIDPRNDSMALQRLKAAVEQTKKDLSQQHTAEILLPFLAIVPEPKHLQMSVTRDQFERLVERLVEKCRQPVMQALADAKLTPGGIDDVILVGGMTRMPCVQALVKEIFGKGGRRQRNTDEGVAIGAAIQGAQLLLGSKSDLLLVDVTPLTLGLETLGGKLMRMIQRNTTIPTQKRQTFLTTRDNQTTATISVYQGEHERVGNSANRKIGEFDLDGIRPAKRGETQIEVTFSMDTNGVLEVTAKELGTGKEKRVQIDGSRRPDEPGASGGHNNYLDPSKER